jgi:DUF4097 and DUF4098 domain-containing protein YvlB
MLVRGWDRSDTMIKVCKAVAADSEQAGKDKLKQITVAIDGGNVTARGPADDGWWIHFLVRAPKGARMELETHNGPISLRDLNATVDARTTNGPLSIRRVAGAITAEAVNGPIKVAESSGNLRVTTSNGPLSVELTSETWKDGSLEGSSRNGPLDLKISPGFRSGVEVEASGHSPFSCQAAACELGKKDWDDRSRRIHLGGEPTLVRLSTVNGPVKIRSATF